MGPYGRHTKLNNHLSIVDRNVILVKRGFAPHPSEELLLLFGVLVPMLNLLVGCKICLDLLDRLEDFPLDIRNEDLKREIDDLSRDGEVYHLLGQAIRVDIELLRRERLSFSGKSLCGDLEDIQVRGENPAEGNVDKCCEENAQIRGYKVKDKDLLHEGRFVGFPGVSEMYSFQDGRLLTVLSLIILKMRELLSKACENSGKSRNESGQDDCGHECLYRHCQLYGRCDLQVGRLTKYCLKGPL